MKFIFLIFLLFCSERVFSQDDEPTYSGSFIEKPLKEVIKDIQESTDYIFYYHPEWVDSAAVSGNFRMTPISKVLASILEDTHLSYFIWQNKVTLTYKTAIVSDLGIKTFYDQRLQVKEPEKGLVFSREYIRPDREEDVENQTIEIGDRRRFISGSKVTIAGYLKEKETGDPVDGTLVYIEKPFTATSSDENGFYSLTIPAGKQTLLFQSVNMKNTRRNLVLFSDGKLDVEMDVDVIALNSVTISADRDINVTSTQMGLTRISVENAKTVPVLLGEKDIIKVASTTSGVQSAGEGAAGLNIRGGKPDQNLFLLDGMTVYNTSHFFGFFSVFNSDAIRGMELYKSGIPPRYGGRLSSVFDISTKEPDKQKVKGTGGIGVVTSSLLLEVPVVKEKLSIMAGARGTYSDFVLRKVTDSPIGNNQVAFRDFIGKMDYKINEKNHLAITGYYSFDSFQLASDSLLSYSAFTFTNANLGARWKHIFTDKFDLNLITGISNYTYTVGYDALQTQAFAIDFDLQELTSMLDLNLYVSNKFSYSFGAMVKKYEVSPGQKNPQGLESIILPDRIDKEFGLEYAGYYSVQFDPVKRWSLNGGLRYSFFTALGPKEEFIYEDDSPSAINRTDTLYYSRNQAVKTYPGAEFRLSARYTLSERSALKWSYNRTRQNIHLLLNSVTIAPTDIWRLSNSYIRPQVADQVSFGIYKNLHSKKDIETSVEVYYKKIQNLIDFKVGATLQFNKTIETDLLQGDGRAYGVEFSIKKSEGWFTGWLNYTYSRSLLRLNGESPDQVVNGGNFFPSGYDKPHYINLVTNYKFTRRFSFSFNMSYSSGIPITLPIGKWTVDFGESLLYSERNAFRIPDYFRVDVGLNLEGTHKIKKLTHSFWSLSIYNVLGIDNIYSIFYKVKDGEINSYKMSVFPTPIPTLSYNFRF